jgi:PAS domain S-box-containing protein
VLDFLRHLLTLQPAPPPGDGRRRVRVRSRRQAPPACAHEARLRSVVAAMPDAVVTLDEVGDVVDWNLQAEATLGWTRAEVLGRDFAAIAVPAASRDAFARLARSGGRCALELAHRDGRALPAEVTVAAADVDGEALTLVFVRDVTDFEAVRRRLSRQAAGTRLLHEATSLAAETDSLDDVLRKCVEAVCALTGWSLGHALAPAPDGEHLVSTGVWFSPDAARFEPLRQATARAFFARGRGLPGRIWATGEPIRIVDVALDPGFERSAACLASGLRGAFGFPIAARGHLRAVLEFFSPERATHVDAETEALVGALAEQVGRVLERKQANDALRESEARARLLAEAGAVFVADLDFERTLRDVAGLCVPTLGDFCIFDVLAEDGRIERVACAHVDPSRRALVERLTAFSPPLLDERHPVAHVMRSGQTLRVPAVDAQQLDAMATCDEHRRVVAELAPASFVTVPVRMRGATAGALTFAIAEGGGRARAHAPVEIALAEELARRVGTAAERRRLASELRLRAAELRRKNSELEHYVYTVSHDLRAPVVTITGFTGVLREDLAAAGAEALLPTVDRIERAARRMDELGAELLELSRIGAVRHDPELVDVGALVREVVTGLDAAIALAGARVEVAPDLPPARGDRRRLAQVFENLLGNALRYGSPAPGDGATFWIALPA